MPAESPPSPLAIGIDFGGTSIKTGLCRGEEIIARRDPIPTGDHATPEALIDAMLGVIKSLRDEHPGITAIGVGVPGFVDFDRGIIHDLTNVRGWENFPLRHILTEKTGLPSVVENDANSMVYAEWRYGSARSFRNVVALTLGTGIGGGLILEDKIYRGCRFGAGEIGQMSIDYQGKPGEYGNTGAAEKYVGARQIAEHAVLKYANLGVAKTLAKTLGECSPKDIAEAAAAGDDIAQQVWGDVAEWLGTVMSSMVWLLNPDAIVIGGGIAKAGDLLFKPLERKMQSMLSPVFWEDLKILPATFGNDAGIIGNAALSLDDLANDAWGRSIFQPRRAGRQGGNI